MEPGVWAMARCPWIQIHRGDIVFLAESRVRARIDADPFFESASPAKMLLRGPLRSNRDPEHAAGLAIVTHASGERFYVRRITDDDSRAQAFLQQWGLSVHDDAQSRSLQISDYGAFWLRFVPRATYRSVQPWELTDAEFQGDVRFYDLQRYLGEANASANQRLNDEYGTYKILREAAYAMARDEYALCFPELAGTIASAFEPSSSTARYLRQAAFRRGYPVPQDTLAPFPDLQRYAREDRVFERTTVGPDAPERRGLEQLVTRSEAQIVQVQAELSEYQERLARCKSEHTTFGRIYARQVRTLREREAALSRQKRFAQRTLARAHEEDLRYEDPAYSVEQLSLM